jgi:hypothetical protein
LTFYLKNGIFLKNLEIFMNLFNMKSVFNAAVGIALLNTALLAFAETTEKNYAYFARKVPASQTNCHDQASQLADRLTQITGHEASGRCEATTTEGNDILIRYEASEPLEVITSATEIGFDGQGYEFSTKAQCEAEVSGEVAFFTRVTGKEPLLSFCRGKENYYGRVRWALIVEGFAKLDKKNAWASSPLPGLPTSDQVQQIKNDLKSEFTDSVTSVRHVFLQDDEKGQLRLTVNYYGKYDEQLKAFSLSSVTTMGQCQQALAEMEAIRSQTTNIKTLPYCVNNPYDAGVDLVVVADVTRWYELRQSAETFKTYDECATARNPLLDVYRSHYPEAILGGFCTEWGSNWKINILELRSKK